MVPSTSTVPNMGQIIEYLPGRLYLASYISEPNAETLFPFQRAARSPSKRQRAVAAEPAREPYYFSVDKTLLYNAFYHDFGPLHIGHLYRFALQFHEVLAETESEQRPVVFWSQADPRSRANASCLLACYMVLIQSWPPHLALAPIAQLDPPLMPFRDAGYSQADYGLTVQDVVYGVWKAKEESCCVLDNFDLTEYETFERVENGDFNWITPHFLAFASPQHEPVARITEESDAALFAALPRTLEAVDAHPSLPEPFKNVLCYFSERNIGLVVRLNSALYSPTYFEALGIQHLDMIFEDGTCPPLSTVRKFVRLAHEMITVRKKSIAVHCKAGLGRTGCLIGAYLIYRHGFTANEIISFMRFMRPGMVVGPQQHWLHLNQGVFREWWVEERLERKLRREYAAAAAATATSSASATNLPSTPIRAMQKTSLGRSSQPPSVSTPPNQRSVSGRSPLSEMDNERTNAAQEDYLPAPTPGQPRKSVRAERQHPYARSRTQFAATMEEEENENVRRGGSGGGAASVDAGILEDEAEAELYLLQQQQQQQQHGAAAGHRSSGGSRSADSEEELYLRMRSAKAHHGHHHSQHSHSQRKAAVASSSPDAAARQRKARSASHNTAAVIAAALDSNDASNDTENIGSALQRVKSVHEGQRSTSASGVLAKVRTSERTSGANTAKKMAGAQPVGIRKSSGRVGSTGAMPSAAAIASASRKISGMQ